MSSPRPPFTPLEERIDHWAGRRASALAAGSGRWRAGLVELVAFGLKQAWACVFGAVMLALVVAARLLYPDGVWLARSDLLVLAAVGVQVAMIALRLESVRELWVVLTFHVVGTVMEVFKTAAGSWRYEVDGLAHIGGVPLYTGVMYAAVGSYMVRVMRLFDLRFTHYPPRWATALLAVAIYANFFTHHYFPDARWVLLAAVLLLHGRCTMRLRSHRRAPWRRMPVVLSFVGVASLLWIAENLGTGVGAWIYPQQADGWHLVPLSKLVSWLLLMQVSVVLVTLVHPPREP